MQQNPYIVSCVLYFTLLQIGPQLAKWHTEVKLKEMEDIQFYYSRYIENIAIT